MGYKGLPTSVEWGGHYERPYGTGSVFHVDTQERIKVVQVDSYSKILCNAVMTSELENLAWAVNGCKLRHAGREGGSFSINEFGWVIVPVLNQHPRVIGRWRGDIEFLDLNDRPFSMAEPVSGDWDYPYLGMKFRLSPSNRIYLKYVSAGLGEVRYDAPYQDSELIKRLRRIRPGRSSMSFLVNPFGVVLTKSDNGYGPVCCAGKIDFANWFPDAMDFEDNSDEADEMFDELDSKRRCMNTEQRNLYDLLSYHRALQNGTFNRWQTWQLAILYNAI